MKNATRHIAALERIAAKMRAKRADRHALLLQAFAAWLVLKKICNETTTP